MSLFELGPDPDTVNVAPLETEDLRQNLVRWCCQSNGNLSPLRRGSPKPDMPSARDCAPLSQRG